MSERRPDDIPASPGNAAGPAPTEASVGTTAVLAGLVAALEASTREQRRARRWRVFFRFLFVGVVLWVAVVAHRYGLPDAGEAGERHTAVVELRGVIDGRGDASSTRVSQALRAAFEHPGTAAVLLRINSPGGSPVQAGIIHDEIRRLRKLHPKVPIHAVVEDICASGGYYVAVAADRIYVDKASLVGSIGVLMEGFGFAGLIEKLGIERRLLTAGANKGFLDSFSPLTPAHRAHTQTLLNQIHAQFVDAVKAGRGERLKPTPETFSGLYWTGEGALDMGLADAFGSVGSVARDVIGEARLVDFSIRDSTIERLGKRLGASAAAALSPLMDAPGATPRLR